MDAIERWLREVLQLAGEIYFKWVEEQLGTLSQALYAWLDDLFEHPRATWREEFAQFVAAQESEGRIILPVSRQAVIDYLERWWATVEKHGGTAAPLAPPVQLAMGPAVDDGTRTDAAPPMNAPPRPPTNDEGLEIAGPGPETTQAFQEKVLVALALLDVEIARWWKGDGGIVRSRAASGWGTFLRSNEKTFVENSRPIVLVDENYTAVESAAAIVRGAERIGSFKDRFDQYRIPGPGDEAGRYAEEQQERVREAAATAGAIAEIYYTSIGSLTVAGDLVVTVDDASRNGLRWDQLFILLPALPFLRKGIKSLIIKLPGGKQLSIPSHLIEALAKLKPAERKEVLAEARKAKTQEEALDTIQRGVKDSRKRGHHLATNKNWISTLRGGPWSPKFEAIFEKAGMTLNDAENIVKIPGHSGPHPEEYHREIFRRLTGATRAKRGTAYKDALVKELQSIAKDCKDKRTTLNRLLTE